ncbi:putative membrane protein [Synechococcus sp. PCC 7502]|uniref:bestrophin family protein n=1 Tax=Synechococcus sp. PCC 7502 TaxID=1173263 RepID=UPI00029FC0DD|nr:bestrophin family ion channel [Synechococcus sp. PCC 7502]AFY74616.1 putative membrane protein [Synechococcus sp. PCC 7502]
MGTVVGSNLSGKPSWFGVAFRYRGSVIPEILPRVIGCGIFGLFIYVLHYLKVRVSFPVLGTLIPNLVLGLLLVFRTNTAYERYWEGRKAWGSIINHIRNLARQILVTIQSHDTETEKIAALHLLAAFAIACKLHLRGEPINPELEPLMSPYQYQKLQSMNHPPLEIMFWLSEYLQTSYKRGQIQIYQLNSLHSLVNNLVDALGSCERIKNTPIPLAYAIHLKQLLLIYCLSLPFQMVDQIEWLTPIVVALISFTLLGIEEIGIQIEDPFGRDSHDLPLDAICKNILRNLRDLIDVYVTAV